MSSSRTQHSTSGESRSTDPLIPSLNSLPQSMEFSTKFETIHVVWMVHVYLGVTSYNFQLYSRDCSSLKANIAATE